MPLHHYAQVGTSPKCSLVIIIIIIIIIIITIIIIIIVIIMALNDFMGPSA